MLLARYLSMFGESPPSSTPRKSEEHDIRDEIKLEGYPSEVFWNES